MSGVALQKLLRAQQEQSADDGSGDVVFVMFLEPHECGSSQSVFDKIVSFAVNQCQPSPVMVHTELVVPPPPGSGAPVSFATYIGEHAAWRTDRAANSRYYLTNTAGHWRALPVFGKHAARLVREACNESDGVEYSLMRYATAAWGLRQVASMVPENARSPAHCATLTARVLRRGVRGLSLIHI